MGKVLLGLGLLSLISSPIIMLFSRRGPQQRTQVSQSKLQYEEFLESKHDLKKRLFSENTEQPFVFNFVRRRVATRHWCGALAPTKMPAGKLRRREHRLAPK
ncbi:hypothetical protein [Weissella cibaria]|nr:hypothetical protein [Weissella cibaria]MCT8398159.1 hypothetical protein [Weissella cibaria]